jgi:hypothetical protein
MGGAMQRGALRAKSVKPFLVFPLDQRSIYYTDRHKWLNEGRAEFAQNVNENEFLVTVPEPRKHSETLPIFRSLS